MFLAYNPNAVPFGEVNFTSSIPARKLDNDL